MVTGGFSEKSSKIWGSFAQNFVYGHFQQPQCDAQSVFLHLICTVWIDWNFILDVQVSYELHSKIFLFRPDGVPVSRKRSHGPLRHLRFGWLLVLGLCIIIYKKNICPINYTAFVFSGKVGCP